MIIKSIKGCSYFQSLDQTKLCELMHPLKEGLNIPYSIAHAVLRPGTESLPHMLRNSSEVYFILEGGGMMFIDNESALVNTGQAIYIPPGSIQHIKNLGTDDLKFLCIVYPSWKKEDEVIVDM
jgi:mannose-6-phosphate isomerase-like protein (cupin superfamily)